MGHANKPEVALDTVHHIKCFVAGAATGTIRHGTEVWLGFCESREHSVEKAFFAFWCLGREKLNRNHGPFVSRTLRINVRNRPHATSVGQKAGLR